MNAHDEDPIETYAAVISEIGAGRPRNEVLAAHALDEASLEALERRALEELTDDASVEGPVPKGELRLDHAFRAARGPVDSPPMSLEAFARATAAAQAGEKVHERFDKMGVRLADFLRASEHFTPRLAKDPALAARFTEMLEKGWKLR